MSDSIRCGVRELPTTTRAILITPADHPAISPHVVSQIIQEWERGSRLIVPTWNGGGGHPVLIDVKFRHQLSNLEKTRGLKGLFDEHRADVSRIPVESPYIARDMDTWDDYGDLHEEVFGVRPPQRGLG
jgi:molybdenum cofactor cytidylyltransferase